MHSPDAFSVVDLVSNIWKLSSDCSTFSAK